MPRTELETAEINVKSAEAQIKSSEAGLVQSQASLNTAKVNLGYTVITAPIDGIVIQRSVDPGQTVAASMNAPTLYVIAKDLTKMQVLANIDESDVGRMRPGQHVTFRVDAYPNEQFTGSVEQVRLQPTVVQNVVVYSTVIRVPNPQLKLKPGHDRERQHRDPAPRQRAARAVRGGAIPSDRVDVPGAQSAGAARDAARRGPSERWWRPRRWRARQSRGWRTGTARRGAAGPTPGSAAAGASSSGSAVDGHPVDVRNPPKHAAAAIAPT